MDENSNSSNISNVILVDPNKINSNNNLINSIPQYQDMCIFVELVAKRKGRTVLQIGGVSNTNDLIEINLLGNVQDENNTNHLMFTTNYYDGSTGDKTTFNSFGISNINVKINSSYIPQVNIQFVDIRGLSFFNQEKSPYRIIFDFPPPTFKLIIKGYYGKPIIYDLHLTKYTTEFQSESGNFLIDAEFVAMTFAPLNDVLFRYIVNFPLIDNPKESNPDAGIAPTNTNSLLIKLKNLYTSVGDRIKNTSEYKQLDIINSNLEKIKLITDTINNINNNVELKNNGDVFLVIKNIKPTPLITDNDDTIQIRIIENLIEFDNIIKEKTTMGDRLSIVYINKILNDNYNPNENNLQTVNYNPTNESDKIKALKNYKDRLISISVDFNDNDIPNPSTFLGNKCIYPLINKKTEYIELDITKFYKKLYNQKINYIIRKGALNDELTDSVNETVSDELGMLPTIYNIFKIILDDVDIFFNKIRETSTKAENAHKIDKRLSESFNLLRDKPIYAFPLVVKNENSTQERIAPIELKNNGHNFPELDLVYDFINTFSTQQLISKSSQIKLEKGDNDIYLWIPLSPIDSKHNETGTNENPYYKPTNNITSHIFKILLSRFYILSQAILNIDFYSEDKNISDVFVNYFSEAEAINLSLMLDNEHIDNILSNIENIKTYDDFYNKYSKLTFDDGSSLFNFSDNKNEIPITKNHSIPISKKNDSYVGLKIEDNPIEIQELDNSSNSLISKFKKDSMNKLGGKWYSKKNTSSIPMFDFTEDNLFYISDYSDNKSNIVNNINLDTRFIWFTTKNKPNDFPKTHEEAYQNGNSKIKSKREVSNMNNHYNIVDRLSYILENGEKYNFNENYITLEDNLMIPLLISIFGTAISPFNTYPYYLNQTIFDCSGIVEVPKFLLVYLGMLIEIEENDNWKNIVINFIKNTSYFSNKGFYFLMDLHDVNKYLSNNDKKIFKIYYNSFIANEYPTLKNKFITLIEEGINYNNPYFYNSKHKIYDYLLNPNSKTNADIPNVPKGHYFKFIEILMERKYIVNYYQSTFQIKDLDDYNDFYESLSTTNKDSTKGVINNQYFMTFFQELKKKIEDRKKELENEEKKYNEIKGDSDIITQTYYSFKNVNDKWLSGGGNSQIGYPYNPDGKNLIDSFAFVDRAMNPIGDTFINAEALIDIFNNPDITVFTALSQLLSANGFEFFPLQNFLSFKTKDSWENMFKTQTGTIPDSPSTHFVCMYIGGSSSYPSVDTDFFNNDGIIDLSLDKDIPDFSSNSEINMNEINNEMVEKSSFPWRKVYAFRVRFGEQNQSMFIDMKIDSKEYPETNESIQILSRLSGDDKKNAPVPKGQNLYNLYENRAYGATISMLGNAAIQPTQYFQLENIPLYNGAYIILNVEHNITPNKMITKFSGTKILKHPIPRVTTPLAYADLGVDLISQSSGEMVRNVLEFQYKNIKINAMYNLKMS